LFSSLGCKEGTFLCLSTLRLLLLHNHSFPCQTPEEWQRVQCAADARVLLELHTECHPIYRLVHDIALTSELLKIKHNIPRGFFSELLPDPKKFEVNKCPP
jgi:hypothetical protein